VKTQKWKSYFSSNSIRGVFIFCILSILSTGLFGQDQDSLLIKSSDEKISLLKDYIKRIADKSIPKTKRTELIDDVLLHFDENATIQVSSAKTGKIITLKAKEYFQRLRDLNYDAVIVDFEKKKNITNVKKSEGNNYSILGRYHQIFKAFINGEKVYHDLTMKNIDIDAIKKYDNTGSPYYDIKIKGIKVATTEDMMNEISTP
jgi:hypothetical protein